MKNSIKKLTAIFAIVFLTFSFTTILNGKKEINTQTSKVVWKGYKVTGSHYGSITIKSGHFNFDANKLAGGEFTIDMSTIVCEDLEGEYKGKLEGHLKSDDFFGVEKYPTASLIIIEVKSEGKNSYKVKGDLTIKGITKSVSFTISIYGNKANVALKIDRTEFNIRYGSASFIDGLKDKAIYDEFDIVGDLEF